ncbi:MAG: hypothetical protein RMJ67_07395 [Elusimicrobiota bacterium]|nr:hypothetical protein [Endomicrobiia bacterium]MDW8166317.1 hypothetical protein [Elusimicrobiota bacterium]
MHLNKFIILIILIVIVSCSKDTKQQLQLKQPSPRTEKTEEIVTITALESQSIKPSRYFYEGLSYRDPFVPVSPEKIAKANFAISGEAKIPSLGVLQLKGFIVDKIDQIALFSSPYGSYILYNGKLYDNHNRLVKGFSGKIIFNKETRQPKGVILIDDNNEYKEFVLSK